MRSRVDIILIDKNSMQTTLIHEAIPNNNKSTRYIYKDLETQIKRQLNMEEV